MQDANSDYKLALARQQKVPVFIVEFGIGTSFDGTPDKGIPTRYSNFNVLQPLAPFKQLLQDVQGGSGQITIDEGSCAAGAFTFSILDQMQEITKLQSQYTMANRRVKIKSGFRDLPERQFITIFQGKIFNFTLTEGNVSWKFETTTLVRDTIQNIFTATSRTTSPVAPTDLTINVFDTSLFAPTTGPGPTPRMFLRINDEVISYTALTPTSFTGCVRGLLGTTPATHAVDDEVRNLAVFQDHPINIALQILTSTGTGTNGPYDVLPESSGLAVPTGLGTFDPGDSFIDVKKFEHERDTWLGNYVFRFEESKSVSAKEFLEQQIYQFVNGYSFTNNLGQLSFKVYTPPLPTLVIPDFNDENLEGSPTWQGNLFERYFFNEIDFSYDWDFLTETFTTRAFYEDLGSQSKYDRTSTKTMESRGIRTGIFGLPRINNVANRFLLRFANPTPVIKTKTFFSQHLVEVGDIVTLTSTHVPNTRNGRLGVVSLPMEVIERTPDYIRGEVTYLLLNTGDAYLKRYKVITPKSIHAQNGGPGAFPDYVSATPLQRLFGFIGKRVVPGVGPGTNIPVTPGEKNFMPNGDEGYYVTP